MGRFKFHAPPHHELELADKLYFGGDVFEADEEAVASVTQVSASDEDVTTEGRKPEERRRVGAQPAVDQGPVSASQPEPDSPENPALQDEQLDTPNEPVGNEQSSGSSFLREVDPVNEGGPATADQPTRGFRS